MEIEEAYFKEELFDFNNEQVKKEALDIVSNVITDFGVTFLPGLEPFGKGSLSTKIFDSYNTFSFKKPYLSFLFKKLQDFFIKSFSPNESYYIQSWINIHHKGENLQWHSHWTPEAKSYHGYIGINVEPSITSYQLPNHIKQIDIENKNNKCVINKSDGDRHKVSIWTCDEPRISIAFDIVPLIYLQKNKLLEKYSHFMPFV